MIVMLNKTPPLPLLNHAQNLKCKALTSLRLLGGQIMADNITSP